MPEAGSAPLFSNVYDDSVAPHPALATIAAGLFAEDDAVLNDRERALMTDILRRLVHEVERELRQTLARRFANERDAPAALVDALAGDSVEAAHPVLRRARVLQDAALVEAVHHRVLEHQLAVAMRREPSESVCLGGGRSDLVESLLRHEDAAVAQATIAYRAEQARRLDTYQNPLLRRAELDAALALRLCFWVGAALRQHIVENFALAPARLDDQLEQASRQLAHAEPAARAAESLADCVAATQPISPALLLAALRDGEVALFEAMLVKLTGLPPLLVRRLVFGPGGEGLAIACRAVGVDAASFAPMLALSRRGRGDAPAAGDTVARVTHQFTELQPDTARRILHDWRREPAYLEARRSLRAARPGDA